MILCIVPAADTLFGKAIVQREGSGLGIGLMLSHASVERYGGSITLANAEGGGTLATLTLPVKPVEADTHG